MSVRFRSKFCEDGASVPKRRFSGYTGRRKNSLHQSYELTLADRSERSNAPGISAEFDLRKENGDGDGVRLPAHQSEGLERSWVETFCSGEREFGGESGEGGEGSLDEGRHLEEGGREREGVANELAFRR